MDSVNTFFDEDQNLFFILFTTIMETITTKANRENTVSEAIAHLINLCLQDHAAAFTNLFFPTDIELNNTVVDLTLEEFKDQFNIADFAKMFCFTIVNKNKLYQKIVGQCNGMREKMNALCNLQEKQSHCSPRTGQVVLKLDVMELDAMCQGAKVSVFLCNQFGRQLVWGFDIKPDATRYVLES